MPLQTVTADAELVLVHQGIEIYHCYRDNNIDEGKRSYLFDIVVNSDECGGTYFDIRDLLSNAKLKASLGSRTQLGTDEDVFEAIRQAIEYRLIDLHGEQEYADLNKVEVEESAGVVHITTRQTATILAALRNYQEDMQSGVLSVPIELLATDGGDLQALTLEDIDELCEFLNCS